MDGQIFKFAGQNDNAEFSIVVSSGDDGGSGMVGIILIVLAVLILLGAAAFFFIEFEETSMTRRTSREMILDPKKTRTPGPRPSKRLRFPSSKPLPPCSRPLRSLNRLLPLHRNTLAGFGTKHPTSGCQTPTTSNHHNSE